MEAKKERFYFARTDQDAGVKFLSEEDLIVEIDTSDLEKEKEEELKKILLESGIVKCVITHKTAKTFAENKK